MRARRPDEPPLAVLVDYDGTIARVDVCDQILLTYSPDRFEAETRAYDTGLIGSRELARGQVERLPGDQDLLLALAAGFPHDPSFAPFVRRTLALGVPVEVVSDGFGFYIGPALQRLGVPPIPVSTNVTVFGGTHPRIEFPNGHPDCLVCGTCKRGRVLAYQASGRAVMFVGDGESDRYAAAYSDLIFAKHNLVEFCRREGFAFTQWRDFTEIEAWLEGTVSRWREDQSTLPGPVARPFICGPEVWGRGRDRPSLPPTEGSTELS